MIVLTGFLLLELPDLSLLFPHGYLGLSELLVFFAFVCLHVEDQGSEHIDKLSENLALVFSPCLILVLYAYFLDVFIDLFLGALACHVVV